MVELRDFNLNLEDPMTEERLPLAELLAKVETAIFCVDWRKPC